MDLGDFPIIAIAISIVICWSLFALLCSFSLEALVQVKAERGRFMRKYLLEQLYDASNQINWASMFYMHGTIDLLSRDAGEPPSFIDPKVFAKTFVEVVGNTVNKQTLEQMGQQITYQHAPLRNFKVATEVLVKSDVVSLMQQAIKSAEQADPEKLSLSNINSEEEGQIYDRLIQNIEGWYNGMISSIEGWYKKKTRSRLFLLGAVLGLLINVDSIQLFEHFRSHPEATKIVMDAYRRDFEKTVNDTAYDTADLNTYLRKIDTLSKSAELPVGYDRSIFKEKNIFFKNYLFFKILGVLITGFAASFGAPFWFDLLKKVYTRKQA